MRIAVVANTSWYLYNFRLNLMRELMAAGHEVVAVGPPDDYIGKLLLAGVRHRAFPLSGASINPLRELRAAWALHRIFREEDIEAVLSYTPKGNIYGAMGAAMNGLPTVPNVSGLGRVFIQPGPLTWLVNLLYRFTFGRAARVFFQNGADLDMFVRMGLVNSSKAERIPGSGVDLARFAPAGQTAASPSTPPAPEPAAAGHADFSSPVNGKEVSEGRGVRQIASREKFVFLLVARLLWDKGVGEYVEAARQVRREYPATMFHLLGFLDVQNPSAISRAQVEAWVAEGVIHYLGSTDDVLPYLHAADCVVLPSSYREGVPRTLLEAAAMAKPLITTDAPGCRDTVDDGITGFLCQPRDANDLAAKIRRMIEMDRDHLHAMGRRGREKMMREFDEQIVIHRYLDVVEEIAQSR